MWRELTEADVLGVLNAVETGRYKSVAAGAGQNVLQDVITAVVNQCRGYIADAKENSLAEGVTLPERVHLSALHIIRVELLTRLDMEASKDRVEARRDAIRFFERVADGRVAIEQPTGTLDTSSPVQTVETLSTHEREATRETLRGL